MLDGAGMTILWLKASTTKPDNLSAVPRTHMMEGEKLNSLKLSSDVHIYVVPVHTTHVHTRTIK